MLLFSRVYLAFFVLWCFLCVCVCVCTFVCKELLLKDEECERLSKVRDQLGQELEELTASLFQVGRHPPVHFLLPVFPHKTHTRTLNTESQLVQSDEEAAEQ